MPLRILILILISFASCKTQPEQPFEEVDKEYSYDVGDILFDSRLDKRDFQLCDSTKISTSRRGLMYLGANGSVERACKQKFVFSPLFESFDGFVTIRFLVNCQHESDRFRVQSMDFDFTEKDCPEELKDHLLQIVRELDEWKHSSPSYEALDHAKFLNFKIEKGRIVNVLQ